ncbi:hypothetical protein LO772_15600 [Yinghuangia sp. ASG 101]|uniref:hypothetical protein n=1 Tax=Yinghuangia sp. ASG 101 TaxID=2896848 RepID=UPI001E654389|nr:hypothetical protein [Yinghuangia sp. ASG 101]UGQ14868.1 hypothetical protein LO772_15600 [Yinghuangia sp. ASG 101]
MDPVQGTDIEAVTGTGDGEAGEAGFGVGDVAGAVLAVVLLDVLGLAFGEVLADADVVPCTGQAHQVGRVSGRKPWRSFLRA